MNETVDHNYSYLTIFIAKLCATYFSSYSPSLRNNFPNKRKMYISNRLLGTKAEITAIQSTEHNVHMLHSLRDETGYKMLIYIKK